MGWLTGVVCTDFSPKEGEDLPATPYITLSTCRGGKTVPRRKQLLLIPLYSGLTRRQEQWDLVNKTVAHHGDGSAKVWDMRAEEHVIEC